MKKNKKRMIIITIAVIVLIAIDQIAKFFIIGKDINIIPNILKFKFSEEVAVPLVLDLKEHLHL